MGPNRVSRFRDSRGRVAWSHNSQNHKKRNADRWVPVLVSRYMRQKSKEWSNFGENIERPSTLPKEKFQNLGNHKERGTIVGCSLKSQKVEIRGNKRCVFDALKESTFIKISTFHNFWFWKLKSRGNSTSGVPKSRNPKYPFGKSPDHILLVRSAELSHTRYSPQGNRRVNLTQGKI
jgi:hypothetical protein